MLTAYAYGQEPEARCGKRTPSPDDIVKAFQAIGEAFGEKQGGISKRMVRY